MANFRYKVSVVIPAYNAEDTIEKAINSIPDRPDVEIIVVDDGSTDSTAKIVRQTGRAVLVRHTDNCGVATAVNTGIDNTQGEYIVLLGSQHPTQKPVTLCARALKNTKKAQNVLDLFGGSGSTLIACEQMGRKCYMMELDPKYCDVIRKRYWKFVTGSEEGWQDGTKAI